MIIYIFSFYKVYYNRRLLMLKYPGTRRSIFTEQLNKYNALQRKLC